MSLVPLVQLEPLVTSVTFGDLGASGVAGATGTTAPLGDFDAAGATGATVAICATGVTGTTGILGDLGATGATGATGTIHAFGAFGANGAAAATGVLGGTAATGAHPLGHPSIRVSMAAALPRSPHSPRITPREPTAITQRGKASPPNLTATARAPPCRRHASIARSPHEPSVHRGHHPTALGPRCDMGTTRGDVSRGRDGAKEQRKCQNHPTSTTPSPPSIRPPAAASSQSRSCPKPVFIFMVSFRLFLLIS